MMPVCLLDMEARTPVGLTAVASAAAVRAGISRITEHPFMVDSAGDPLRGGRDARLEPTLLGAHRLAAMAAEPLTRLCARVPVEMGHNLFVIVALPEHRPGWRDEDEVLVLDSVSTLLRPRFPNLRVVACERGHAGALQGIQYAASLIGAGTTDICLVGGIDSYFQTDTLDWLFAEKRIATRETRAGFFPGEAAAFLLLGSTGLRRRMRRDRCPQIRDACIATESCTIDTGKECHGVGLAYALDRAAASLQPGEQIDRVICDINGERYRSEEWGLAALRARPFVRDPSAYEAPAVSWGDVGAASGALFAILAAQGWIRGYSCDARAVLIAGSDTGLRAAALLERG